MSEPSAVVLTETAAAQSAPAASPILVVDGFEGPLDGLLELARDRRIDLARLSIVALIDAFGDAMEAALTRTPDTPAPDLTRWAVWTVMAAQLTELRSRLLWSADARDTRSAQEAVEALRRRLIRREAIAAAADRLAHWPQLGFEVFARGRQNTVSAAAESRDEYWIEADDVSAGLEDDRPVPGGDLTDLLRACLVALRPPAEAALAPPQRLLFWTVGEAAARIVRLLDGLPDGLALGALLPTIARDDPDRALRCRAAVAATFLAGLELTRAGTVALAQDAAWAPIHVSHRPPGSDGGARPR